MENKKDAGWRKGEKSREREICQIRQCSGNDEEEKGRVGGGRDDREDIFRKSKKT